MTTGTVKRTATSKWLSTSMLGGGALLCLLGAPVAAYADDLPTGGSVAAGAATIASNGQTTTVNQTTSRAVINWGSFSVGQDKTVDFIQPDASSATLNRVTGNTTSTIAGLIRSNGAVYLINPNGIAITATGSVQTGGGFVASTLNMADNDFMGGKIRFAGSGSSAGVSNAGHITAGQGAYVALLGGSVANSGTIAVPLGRVGLGSGESITLDLNGDGFMQVAVPTSALTGDRALIDHSGTISASGGLVMLTAATVKDAVRNVINLSGGISADSAVGSGGRIILFGGDGGTVNATGTLSARATGATGNGGLVETSGANVDFTGLKVDTSAAHGLTGTWLIDPTDLTVDAAAASTISTNLATSNVMLQTTASGATGPGVTSAGAGDINVNAGIYWDSANTLTLSAYRNVNINAALVSNSSYGEMVLRSDNTGSSVGSVYFGAAGSAKAGYNNKPDITIYYNAASYTTPKDFSTNVQSAYFAYMLVNNVVDLQNINQNISANYALGRDIDASVTASWNGGAGFVPIGTDGANNILGSGIGFSGHFDGLGHTINGLTINRPNSDYVGLFGVASNLDGGSGGFGIQDYQNFSVTNGNIIGRSYVGGIFGYLGKISNAAASLRNINFSGSVTGSQTSGNNVGGVIGYLPSYYSWLGQVTSRGTVTGYLGVGGIIGVSYSSRMTNIYSTSNVTGDSFVGGLVGNGGMEATGVFATGNITGRSFVGGLFGETSGGVNNAYSTGTITATPGVDNVYFGGLIGYASGSSVWNAYSTSTINAPNSQYVGGLIGHDYQTNVKTSYYAGSINAVGSQYVGALIGDSVGYSTAINSVYWDKSIIGASATQAIGSDSVVSGSFTGGGLTTGQLQDFGNYTSTYASWDFAGIWSPPTQAGQGGQSQGYYPQLYALTPVVVASAANASHVYGAANPAFSVTINSGGPLNFFGNGYVFGPTGSTQGGDSISSQSLVSAGLTSSLSIGQYAILGNSATSTHGVVYRVIDAGTGRLTITPAALTVTYTADPLSRLYGSANPAFTGTQSATGLVNGDTLVGVTSGTAVYGTAATSGSNVGSYAITGSGLSAKSGNYTFNFVQAAGNATALSITPASATITYTANPFSRLYGAANPSFTGTQSASGLVNGDTLAGVTSGTAIYGTTATSGSNVGSYAINGSGLSGNSGNYNLTFVQAASNATALSITPAPLTVTYTADPISRIYGSSPTFSGTQSAIGLVNGDTLAGVTTGSATYGSTGNHLSNVGSYAINGNGLSGNSGNYNVTFVQAAGNATAYTITPATVTVIYTANPVARSYGAANPAFTGTQFTYGLANGDNLEDVATGAAIYSSTANTMSNAGLYAVTGSGISGNSANYIFNFTQSSNNYTALRINPAVATITYTADPFTRLYGAADPVFTGTQSATGLVNGDTVASVTTGTAVYGPGANSSSNVGSYAINGSGLFGSTGNYNLIFVQAAGNATALSITPASLSVNANPLSRTYGAANPALTYSSTGLVNGDTLSGALATTATSSSNVGSYAITQGNLAASSNYVLTFTGASLIINPAALTVTYTADPISRLYGAANPTFTGTQSASGLVNGDTLTGVTTGTAVYGSTATSGANVGSYAVTGSGLTGNSGNYAFTFVQAAGNATALSVTPASATITYTADPFSRLYGAANPAFTGTQSATGLVNGDTLAGVTSGTAVYGSTATSGSNVGSYAINGSGLSGSTGNYNLTFVQAAGNATALSITPTSLTISYSANPLSRLYGAANPTLTGTQSGTGLVNGDTVASVTSGTASYSSAANASSNVGTYAVTGSGLSANSGNYNFTFVQGAGNATALSVTPASVTITYTADPFSRLYGAANPAFTGTQSATGLVNGDTLGGVTSGTAVYDTTATSGSNVGSYAINGSGLSGNSGNYIFTFAQAAGNATALSATPASVTITYTANPFSRLYGAANPAFTGTQSAAGLVNGDTLGGITAGTAIYGSTANATSNVGSYAINGSGLSGNSGNYTFTFAQAAGNATALSVTPASLSVVANPLSRTYGAANPALTYSATGLLNGDTLSGALATTATSNSNVGTYAITQGNLAASSNYTLTFTGASLIINPAALTVTYTASPLSRIYGNANPAFTGTQSATGLVNGDTLAGITSGTASYSSTATVTSNVGSYAITGSGLSANSANYSFTFVQAAGNATALSVTPRALSVTANPLSRQFGAPNPPLTYVVGATTATSGLVNGDVLTGALSTTATQTSPSGDYLILQGTLAASSNYTFTYTGAVLKIALPPLQSLSSFIARPSDLNVTLATEQSQGCTDAEVSESMRETGSAKLGDGSGSTSCK